MIEGEACNCLENVCDQVWLQFECWYDKTYRDNDLLKRSTGNYSAIIKALTSHDILLNLI